MNYLKGANYGNIFIPEDFFADDGFFRANGVVKVADQYSLCDLNNNKQQAMTNWLDMMIKE